MPTQQGGAKAPSKPTPTPREELIARMAARVAESRGEMDLPPELPTGDDEEVETPDSPTAEGTEVEKESPSVTKTDDSDPLAEFIVVNDGKPMVKLKVDGSERLVPLDSARATLQKHEAADKRLQAAATLQKTLEAREAALQAREAELLAKSKSSQPSPGAADDSDLDEEARELAHSLLNSTEEEVAVSLKKVLSRRQATPAVDVDAIVSKAAQTAETRVAERAKTESIQTGWQQFQKEYPDIATDQKLLVVADRMTDEIAAEHPEWTPAQVMLESGERTRAWLKGFAPAASSQPSDRQKAKEQLRPLPQSRTGRVAPEQAAKPQSPSDYLAEVRKRRGQQP